MRVFESGTFISFCVYIIKTVKLKICENVSWLPVILVKFNVFFFANVATEERFVDRCSEIC